MELVIRLQYFIRLYSPFAEPLSLQKFTFIKLIKCTDGRIYRTRDQPLRGRYIHTGQHKNRINAHKHSCLPLESSQDFSVGTGEDSSCFRLRSHFDRLVYNFYIVIYAIPR
jgi:hypothetical protein